MAKFNISDLEHYAQPTVNYFSLKDDKDTALIRFMYNSVDDIDAYSVHKLKINGYDRYVNCLRGYTDTVESCPLCNAKFPIYARFFLQMYDIDTGKTMLWDRNSRFSAQLMALKAHCNPLVSVPIEVERNGARDSMQTYYEFYPEASDGTTLEDLPEPIDPIGTIIYDKTYEELLTYVQTGSFESGDANPVNNQSYTRFNNQGQSNMANSDVRRRRDVSANNSTRRRTTGSNSGNTPL